MKEVDRRPRKDDHDYWEYYWNTIWRIEDNKFNNPSLIAARILAEKGFGISLKPLFDRSGNTPPNNPDNNLIAIHADTAEDRKALDVLESAPELSGLRRAFHLGTPIDNPASWYVNAEQDIEQVIEQRKLRPKLIRRLKKALG